MTSFDIPEISAREAADFLKRDPNARLIDVRTEEEYATARIPGAVLAVKEGILDQLLALPKDTPLVIHCHHGVRSLQGAGFFLQRGFTNVVSMAGGIDAWSEDVDPTVPRY